MNIFAHITVATYLLVTACPISAEDMNDKGQSANHKVQIHKDNPEKVVHVGGFVKHPGPVKYKKGATIYDMIMAAGGPSEFGTLKRVLVYRGSHRTVHDMTKKKVQSSLLAEPDDDIDVRPTIIPEG